MENCTAKATVFSVSDRLHWYHWLAFFFSLLLTAFACLYADFQIHEKNSQEFDREVDKTLDQIRERMQKYEDVLWSGAGLFNSSDDVTATEWHHFAGTIAIEKKYPGINGIGAIFLLRSGQVSQFIENQKKTRPSFSIHPKHSKDVYIPITYIEPLEGNKNALGLDIAHEKNRYQAAIKAWETGKPQMTGPIQLVQSQEKTPGFLLYVPVYAKNQAKPLGQPQTADYDVLIYAPFIVRKLMLGTLAKEGRHIGITIRDDNKILFNENTPDHHDYDPNPLFKSTVKKDMYGRVWQFNFETDLVFRQFAKNSQPLFILIVGLTIDALLLLLFYSLARSNHKAVEYANKITKDLKEKAVKLEKSNKELEKFAYITSHDLKAPLRGIENLVSWIEEDSPGELNAQTKDYLSKIKVRISRMNALIQGILDYSKISLKKDVDEDTIDVASVLHELQDQYSAHPEVFISIPPELPLLHGSPVHFKQVVSNLISNAVKHNDKPAKKIDINCHNNEGHIIFTFKDNGPGIDPMFHSKIFELFHTLQPKDVHESTGVGLAIVKKIIDDRGGQIWVDSEKDKGTQFSFTWPLQKVSL